MSPSPGRDDFLKSVQTELSIRAGLRCSAPQCKVLTKGPADRPAGVVSIGVACHMNAAAAGDPRFAPNQSSAERASIENGIWLCANCARAVDADPAEYPVESLLEWKRRHEDEVRRSIGRLPEAPARMPELAVEERYLDQKGIRQKLAEAGFRIAGCHRFEANTRIGLGEADYVVDPDTVQGPVRLVAGNAFGEDLVFVAVPAKELNRLGLPL